jgi:hypothetical protein
MAPQCAGIYPGEALPQALFECIPGVSASKSHQAATRSARFKYQQAKAMAQQITLEDRAVQILEAQLPVGSRPAKRSALLTSAIKILRKELKMNLQEAQAMAEIWVDNEELLIDREPYEIIALLREDVASRKRQKVQMFWVFGILSVLMLVLAFFNGFENFGTIICFLGLFSASAVLGGKAQLAVGYTEKLSRPEAMAPLADAYLSSDSTSRAAAIPALQGAMAACLQADSLDAEARDAIELLSRRAPDQHVKAAAQDTLKALQSGRAGLQSTPASAVEQDDEQIEETA